MQKLTIYIYIKIDHDIKYTTHTFFSGKAYLPLDFPPDFYVQDCGEEG